MGKPKKLRWTPEEWNVDNPGLFWLSHRLVRRLLPDLYGFRAWLAQRRHDRRGTYSAKDYLQEQLWLGSIQAAVVVSTFPRRVAAYSDELDCVAMLDVPPRLMDFHGLGLGDRLLTVNYYSSGPKHDDLDFGPGNRCDWNGFIPLVADFVADDRERLAEREAALDERYWRRCEELGQAYLKRRPHDYRSGVPRVEGD
jgi:hypothetical protein